MYDTLHRMRWLGLWGISICLAIQSYGAAQSTDEANVVVEGEARIVGGTPVKETTKFPFFAIPRDGTLCGATLVHEDILVSAAHCEGVFTNRDIFIGTTFLNGEDAREKLKTTYETIHPSFDEITMENDIMLVKLASKSSITPVQLSVSSAIPAAGVTGTVIGFGSSKFKGEVSSNLQEAKVDVVEHSKCELGYGRLNSTLHFCAGSPGKDACTGDSGGPLLGPNNVLQGIVSFGYQCGSEGFPGVYTRVGAVDDFINQGICSMSNNPPSRCNSVCGRPANRCSGLFTKKGSRLHKMDGNCVETCASFFTSMLKSTGWRCGRCL